MTTHEQVTRLWEGLRDAIDTAYKAATPGSDTASTLRDYTRDGGWHDDLEKLLNMETANERQHRRGSASPKDFSARTAAMLLLCNNAAEGAQMPPATAFLVYRKSAVEAQVLGWLVRDQLKAEWIAEVESLDYAKFMEVKS